MSAQQNNAALAKPLTFEERLAAVSGSFRNAKAVTQRLEWASKNCHLVAPATSCGSLPEGCAVAFASVTVDVANETYELTGGKLGLARPALDKIGGALGISWDPKQSRRLDDGSDSRYVHYKAVGHYRHFDGTIVTIQGEKEMDLRDDSAQVDALYTRYRAKLAAFKAGRGGKYEPKSPDSQINEMRLHILAHAESKARLRAICNTGVRRSYSVEELQKPFVVARIMFTGQSDDPALRAMFARGTMEAMLGSARALYGAPSEPAQPVAHTYLPAPSHAPPPVGRSAVRDDDDDNPALRSHVDAQPDSTPPSTASTTAGPTPPKTPDGGGAKTPPAAGTKQALSGVTVQFGDEAGTPIENASSETLEWYVGALAKSLNDPKKAQWKAANEKDVAAIRAEQQRRRDEERQAEREEAASEAAANREAEDDFPADYDRGSNPDKY